jgi:Transcription factor WhiB
MEIQTVPSGQRKEMPDKNRKWTIPDGIMTMEPPKILAPTPCVGMTDLMFSESKAEQLQAKKLCRSCPVSVNCLADALARCDYFGVWGGYTGRERREIAAQLRRKQEHEELRVRASAAR